MEGHGTTDAVCVGSSPTGSANQSYQSCRDKLDVASRICNIGEITPRKVTGFLWNCSSVGRAGD